MTKDYITYSRENGGRVLLLFLLFLLAIYEFSHAGYSAFAIVCIFPEINIDTIDRIQGMNITFVTSAKTDEEGYALLKAFGLPFKNAKNA